MQWQLGVLATLANIFDSIVKTHLLNEKVNFELKAFTAEI